MFFFQMQINICLKKQRTVHDHPYNDVLYANVFVKIGMRNECEINWYNGTT